MHLKKNNQKNKHLEKFKFFSRFEKKRQPIHLKAQNIKLQLPYRSH